MRIQVLALNSGSVIRDYVDCPAKGLLPSCGFVTGSGTSCPLFGFSRACADTFGRVFRNVGATTSLVRLQTAAHGQWIAI